jgi:hypothetical protein
LNIIRRLLFIRKIKLKWRRLKKVVPLSQPSLALGPAVTTQSLVEVQVIEGRLKEIAMKRKKTLMSQLRTDLLPRCGQHRKSFGRRMKLLQ